VTAAAGQVAAAPPAVGFGVLGPLEVATAGRVLDLGGPRVRAVLALLVASVGEVVSVAGLAEELWGAEPPPDAERTVRAYVSRLRKALPPADSQPPAELIVTRPPGYALQVGPDAVDARRFEQLAAAGRLALAAGQPAQAAHQLAAALRLWRGHAYGEFTDIPALRAEGARLEQARLTALADRIEADLACGRGEELVAELEGLTARHGSHERLWGQLMTALYRAGRQTDALATYRRARTALVEESGVEPAPVLTEIHQRILAQDPSLLAPQPARPVLAVGDTGTGPAQLPADVGGFTGRDAELAALDAALDAAGPQPTTVVISAVSGTAGVGKTALAVHWAHRVAERFPDGQLYVNLRGFDPGGQAMTPAEAIRGFLDALGVPASRIPPSLDTQAALYRSTLAGKRILIVLDNARDAEQARPLLPGTATATVVVTSRNQLAGLVAADAARPITLDLLTPGEAGELLARRLGPARLAAEPQAAKDIVTRCARLPLALTIAAARGATHPSFPLTALAAELAEASDRLDILTSGDPATDVRAVFSWSYQALTAAAARLFRLLGLHPGAEISAAAAASLAGQPLTAIRPQLAELTRANLVTEHAPGRYTCHDLLSAYATNLTHGTDPEQVRRAAIGRLLDYYAQTADAAERLLNPERDPIPLPLPETRSAQVSDQKQAKAWLAAEHSALLAALRLAADTGFDTHAWQLAWALDTFVDRRGHLTDLAAAWQTALRAAERMDHPAAQAYAHCYLAITYARLDDYPAARSHLTPALELSTRAGDLLGQAQAHQCTAGIAVREGRLGEALQHAKQSLTLHQAAGHRRGAANSLNNLGWCHAQLGDYPEALSYCEQALTLQQELGDRAGEASTWDSLGYAHHRLGQHPEAADCYRHALDLYQDIGHRYEEAATLSRLGDAHHTAGNTAEARAAWHCALEIFTDLDHAEAAELRAKLAG
jgi:DNA-binding SARP family transcriptional activator/Tfp pilus assembly protein PilF/CheY-like chemotaxis protein